MAPDGSLQHIRVLDDRAVFMATAGRNDYSQFGEDGLIEALFEKIGTSNLWCFEAGAADGMFYSNTKRLRDLGWSSVLVEPDLDQFKKLMDHQDQKSTLFNERIGWDGIDRILSEAAAPTDIDLVVIDVDGQDYWLWDGMRHFKPRVLLIEFAYNSPDGYIPHLNDEGSLGAGIDAMKELGDAKGYALLAKTYCNLLFCREELLS